MSKPIANEQNSSHEQLTHFNELIAEFNTAMLVTRTSQDELRARPMTLAQRDPDNNLYFVTRDEKTGKIAELLSHSSINITMQQTDKYLSISGHAELLDEQSRIYDMWQPAWKVWFPEGKEDPMLRLIKVTPSIGEYWDIAGVRKLSLIWKAGKAWIQGERIDPETIGDHAKISL